MEKTTNKAVKAGAAYTVGNIFLKGITFLTLPIFSRILTPEEFGLFSVYVSYESVLTIFVGLCLFGSVRTGKYDYKNNYEEYVSSALCLSTCFVISVFILANIFFASFSSFFEFNRLVLNVLIAHSYAMSVIQFYNTKLALEFKYKQYLIASGVASVGGTFLSIVFILCGLSENAYSDRIYGYAVPAIIVGAVIWITIIKKAINNKYCLFNLKYWKYGLYISIPLIFHNFSQQVLSQFDRLMINKMIGEAATGIYSFVYTIGNILQIIVLSMDSAWSAWFFERLNNKEYKQINKVASDYIALMILMYVGFVSLAPDVICLFGTKEYCASVEMVVPIAYSAYFLFLYAMPVHVEYFYKKTKFVAIGTIGAAIINFLLNYVCIAKCGFQAAAWTTLVSYVCMFLFHWFIARRIDGNNMFPGKKMFGSIIVTTIYSIWIIYMINYCWIRWISMIVMICGLALTHKKLIEEFVLPMVKNKIRKG